MEISIVELKPSDVDEFYSFIKRQEKNDLELFTRWRDHAHSDELLKKFSKDECNKNLEDGIRIVAKIDKKSICGFGLIDFFKHSSKKHVAAVGTIVDKKYRGHGIGKKLLEKEVEIGKLNNKIKLRATIHEENIESLNLHKSLNFEIEGKFVAEEFVNKYRNVLSLALFLKPIM